MNVRRIKIGVLGAVLAFTVESFTRGAPIINMGRWDLRDKTAVITGGSKVPEPPTPPRNVPITRWNHSTQGLGLACVEEFLALGAKILIVSRGAK